MRALTLVVPGPVKDSALTRGIFNPGWAALLGLCAEQGWPARRPRRRRSPPAAKGFVALRADAQRAKDRAMQLEVSRPIGRLWDIDVLDTQGRILSRRDIRPAGTAPAVRPTGQICARQRRHSSEQLHAEMERMFNDMDLPINLPAHRAEPACDFAAPLSRAAGGGQPHAQAGAGGSP
ncbi:citrate lyase holo-[acyl-carrier protein] synthase [Serratia ureilytica]